ncbi:hypothetical protein [Halogeometricum sp. CBA1124]|uniref:hypothetical protein n=1 Tax=Halogeometricum sp. CBA1124 TaxID=2668071 RepID=UPI00142BF2D8|nr:hypothetical protein [Halogeometricum sp. CBA1124]MUV57248.1 hypothetical protein [Halogeometricum sp. CBA1124]
MGDDEASSEESREQPNSDEGLGRRELLGLAGAGGLTLLAGCNGGGGGGVDVLADGSLVASDVHRIDFNGLTKVESQDDLVSVDTSVTGQDAELGV